MYNGISGVRISYFPWELVALSLHSRLGFVLGTTLGRTNQMAARGWRMAPLQEVAIPIDVTPHTWECQDPKSFLHF